MPLVESRYANALIQVAMAQNATQKVYEELKEVANVYETMPDLQLFLLNPEIKAGFKKDTLVSLLKGQCSQSLQNFLLLLVDKSRIAFLPGIVSEYKRIWDGIQNILHIRIHTPKALEKDEIAKIEAKYKTMYKASQVQSEIIEEAELLGGLKVVVGDKIFDGSIKGRLQSLKDLMMS